MRVQKRTIGAPSTFGERLLWCRVREGWTARDVQRRTGVSASTISRAERGIGEPTFSGAVALARAYGVSLDWLATGSTRKRKRAKRSVVGGRHDGK